MLAAAFGLSQLFLAVPLDYDAVRYAGARPRAGSAGSSPEAGASGACRRCCSAPVFAGLAARLAFDGRR
jgi:hypothetical protein